MSNAQVTIAEQKLLKQNNQLKVLKEEVEKINQLMKRIERVLQVKTRI